MAMEAEEILRGAPVGPAEEDARPTDDDIRRAKLTTLEAQERAANAQLQLFEAQLGLVDQQQRTAIAQELAANRTPAPAPIVAPAPAQYEWWQVTVGLAALAVLFLALLVGAERIQAMNRPIPTPVASAVIPTALETRLTNLERDVNDTRRETARGTSSLEREVGDVKSLLTTSILVSTRRPAEEPTPTPAKTNISAIPVSAVDQVQRDLREVQQASTSDIYLSELHWSLVNRQAIVYYEYNEKPHTLNRERKTFEVVIPEGWQFEVQTLANGTKVFNPGERAEVRFGYRTFTAYKLDN